MGCDAYQGQTESENRLIDEATAKQGGQSTGGAGVERVQSLACNSWKTAVGLGWP